MADPAKIADDLGRNFVAKPKVYLAALYLVAGLAATAYMAEEASETTTGGPNGQGTELWAGFGNSTSTSAGATLLQNILFWPWALYQFHEINSA
jgi:hypothetical protein